MAYILVVDDDDIVAEHAAQVLREAGHECGWACDAESAWDLLQARRPDLILLDHHMPGENGGSLLRRIRGSSDCRDVPVVMLTGVHGIEQDQTAHSNGAQDYIRKPFSERMLLYRVKDSLRPLQSPTCPQGAGACAAILQGYSARKAIRASSSGS